MTLFENLFEWVVQRQMACTPLYSSLLLLWGKPQSSGELYFSESGSTCVGGLQACRGFSTTSNIMALQKYVVSVLPTCSSVAFLRRAASASLACRLLWIFSCSLRLSICSTSSALLPKLTSHRAEEAAERQHRGPPAVHSFHEWAPAEHFTLAAGCSCHCSLQQWHSCHVPKEMNEELKLNRWQ